MKTTTGSAPPSGAIRLWFFHDCLLFAQNPEAPLPLLMDVCWIYGRSGAIGALSHWSQMHTHSTCTCAEMDAQKKNPSDSSMKPAVATWVTTLTLFQGLKRNNRTVVKREKASWGRVHIAEVMILCQCLEINTQSWSSKRDTESNRAKICKEHGGRVRSSYGNWISKWNRAITTLKASHSSDNHWYAAWMPGQCFPLDLSVFSVDLAN